MILFIILSVANAVSLRSACRSYDGGDLISCNWEYGSTPYSYLVGNPVPQTTVLDNQYFDITYSSSGYETEARSLFFDSRITGSSCLDLDGCTINNGNWKTVCYDNSGGWHVCNIYYNNEDINYFYVEDSTGVVTFVPYLKTGTNVAPTFGIVGNLTYTEDTGIKNDIYDLWAIVGDDNDIDSALTFELISQSNSGLINCYIDSNRYVDCNASSANQTGTNVLTLKATDSKGLSRTQNVSVIITPVNDAPTIPINLSFNSGIYGNTNNTVHLECSGSIDVDSILYYNIQSNISGNWTSIALNDSDGIFDFDISNYSSVSNVGFRCQATDLNLSSNYFTSSNTIEIDDTAPTISNLTANNIEYGNNNTVSVEVSDKNGVNRVILEVNGLYNYTMNLTSANIFNYTFVNPDNGIYGLKFFAYDSFNNLNDSVIGSFVVNDTIAPIWSLMPSNQTIEFGDSFSYDVNASDLQTVIYSLNDTTNFAIDNVTGLITNNSALNVGVYNLELNATDLSGNVNSTNIFIIVEDTTAPSISNSVAGDVEFDGNVTFSVNVTDLSGVSNVWVELDNSSIYNLSNVGGDIYNYTLTSPSIGSYNFTIYANDSYNNIANVSGNFSVQDTTAPSVFGLNLASSVELGNNVIIEVNVTDLTLDNAWIEINGSNQSMINISNDTYQINLSGLGVGIYPFIIYANDSQNNLNDSVTGSVSVVDSVAPTVVGLVYNLTVEYDADVEFSVNVSDLSNISNVYLEYSGTNYSMTDLDLDGVYNYTLNNSIVGDDQTFTIYAIDIYGNINDSVVGSFNVTDSTAPTWDFAVVNQIVEYGYNFSYDVNATDLQTIVYSLNDTVNFAIDNITGLITNNTILGIGDYSLQVNATDLSGNVNTSSFNVTVQDTIVPTWNEVLTNQTVEYGDSFSYDVNAFDLRTVVYSLNDTTNFKINSSTGLIENATSLGIGNYSLEINASDGINVNSSIIIISVVDSIAPTWDEVLIDQTVEYGDSFSYDVNASDLNGVIYSINDSTNFVINSSTGLIENATSLGIGNYSLQINATDLSGNVNSSIITIIVDDTVFPIWSPIPSNQTIEFGDSFSYDVNATDLQTIIYSINDSANFKINSSSGLISNNTNLGVRIYNLEVRASDGVNDNSTSFNLTVQDTTNPSVVGLIYNSTVEYNANVEFSVNVSDLSNISNVYLEYAGTNYSMTDLDLDGVYNYTLGSPNVGDNQLFTIYAIDNYGNVNDSEGGSFNVTDNTAPSVVITNSSLVVEYDNDVTVNVTISDLSGIDTVLLEVNGTNYSMINSSLVDYSVTVSGLGIGTHPFIIYANDTNGNINNSETGNIDIIDTTAPSIIDLLAGDVEFDGNITFSVNVTDLSGVSKVWVELDNSSIYNLTNVGGDIYNYILASPSIGSYNFTVYANDSHNNIANVTSSFIVDDSIIPSVFGLNATSPVELGNNVIIDINVTDLTLDNIWIEINGSNQSMTNILNDTYQINLSGLGVGIYPFIIYANDSQNNLNDSVTGSVSVVDSIAPSVIGLIYNSTVEYDADVEFSVNVSDLSSISNVYLEYAGTNYSMSDLDLDGIYNYTLTNASVGDNQLFTIYAIDIYGNINGSESGSFNITDNTNPIAILVSAPSPVEYDADVNITVNASDLNLASVWVEINSSNLSMTSLGNNIYGILVSGLGVGTYPFTVYANDSYGNVNDSVSGSVDVVDTTSPVFENISYLGSVEYDNNLTVEVNISDLSLIDTVLFEYSGVNNSMQDLGNGVYDYTLVSPSVGDNQLFTIYVNDSYNNSNSVVGQFNVTEVTAPEVILVSAPSLVEFDNDIVVDVIASDLSGIDSVLLEINSANYTMINSSLSNYSVTVSGLGVGTYPFIVYVNDSYGNMNNSVSGSVSVVDTTSPLFENISYLGSVEYDNNLTVEVNISDLSLIDTVLFEYSGMNYSMTDLDLDGVYNYTLESPSVGNNQLFTIYINDTYGNSNSVVGQFNVTDTNTPTWDEVLVDQSVELGDDFSYDVNASDLQTIIYSINDTSNFAIDNVTGLITNNTFLGIGNYSLEINASDGVNINNVSIVVSVVDTTKPMWSPVPSNQTIELGSSFSYDVDATDLQTVVYSINDSRFSINSSTGLISNATGLGIGNYNLQVNATDLSGNVNSTSFNLTVEDTTAPTWDEVLVDQNIELGDSFSYDVNASDLSGIVYSINDSANFVINSSTGLISNNTGLVIGNYSLEINATDLSGNVLSSNIVVRVGDFTAPSVVGLVYNSTIEYNANVEFSVNVSDLNGISNVYLEFAGTNYSMSDLDLDGVYNYTLASPSVGSNQLFTIYAIDNSENVNDSVGGSFNVTDITGPVWDFAVVNQTLELGNTFSYDVNATDLQTVIYSINDSRFDINSSGFITNNSALSVGIYNLEITASDGTNNNVTSFNLTVEDTTAPFVTNSVAPITVLENESVNITVDVSDFGGVDSVVAIINNGTNSTEYNMSLLSGNTYNLTLIGMVGGSYNIVYNAIDVNGNYNDSVSDSFYVVDVNVAPVIDVFTPTNATVFSEGDTLEIVVNASDLDGNIPTIYLYNNNTQVANSNTGSLSYNYTFNNTEAGNYIFTAVATDGILNDTVVREYVVNDKAIPDLSSVTPDGSTVLYGSNQNISIIPDREIDTGSVVLIVNGVDVTGSAVISNSSINYSASDLVHGVNSVNVTASDLVGNTESYNWTFTVDLISTVSGNIVDSNGNGIGNANVTVTYASNSSYVDSSDVFVNGVWKKEFDLSEGTYTLTFAADGYSTDSTNITVDGHDQVVNFTLYKAPNVRVTSLSHNPSYEVEYQDITFTTDLSYDGNIANDVNVSLYFDNGTLIDSKNVSIDGNNATFSVDLVWENATVGNSSFYVNVTMNEDRVSNDNSASEYDISVVPIEDVLSLGIRGVPGFAIPEGSYTFNVYTDVINGANVDLHNIPLTFIVGNGVTLNTAPDNVVFDIAAGAKKTNTWSISFDVNSTYLNNVSNVSAKIYNDVSLVKNITASVGGIY